MLGVSLEEQTQHRELLNLRGSGRDTLQNRWPMRPKSFRVAIVYWETELGQTTSWTGDLVKDTEMRWITVTQDLSLWRSLVEAYIQQQTSFGKNDVDGEERLTKLITYSLTETFDEYKYNSKQIVEQEYDIVCLYVQSINK